MIIPLNLPGEKSKALSIVATTEGYSVALVDIVDAYGFYACESYESLIPTDKEVIEPITWFDKQLAKGTDLLQCLNDAMSALTK